MKKILIIIATISLFTGSATCQLISPATGQGNINIADALFIKAKKQKTAAWVLLGGGAALTTIGVLTFPKNYDLFGFFNSAGTESQASFSTILAITGSLSMLGSIPVFIAAGKNKRRAELAVSSQKTGLYLPGKISNNVTVISLSIPIGK